MERSDASEDRNRFAVKPTAETHFSWLRTRMSVERTLMSWVRTAVALIGFGFTIFQFLNRFNRMPNVQPASHPRAPWIFSLALIGAGTIALLIALWEYRWGVRYLWREEYKSIAGVGDRWHTPIMAVALVLIAIGVFAFVAVLLQVV